MLPSQLAPFELVVLDQQGVEIPVPRNEDRLCFENFTQLVTHLKDHPDYEVAEHTRLGVGFEVAEKSTTELVGVMAYRRTLNGKTLKVTSFKVRGPIPNLSVDSWYLDFAG